MTVTTQSTATGRARAERLGYPASWLAAVPPQALAGFSGAGNPLALAAVRPGDRVLDLGCGSGTDGFVAAAMTGESGWVLGIDLAEHELCRARTLRDRWEMPHIAFLKGNIADPPVARGDMDVVIANGVLHLVADAEVVLAAAGRALYPGGRLVVSDPTGHDHALAIGLAGLVVREVHEEPDGAVTVVAVKPA